MFFVGLDVLEGILDVLKIFIVLQFLPVQQLQRAVHLNKIYTALHHHCVFGGSLKEVVYLLKLSYDGGTASDVVVCLAVQDQNLLLLLQECLAFFVAFLEEFLALLDITLQVLDFCLEEASFLQHLEVMSGKGVVIIDEFIAFEVVGSPFGQVHELMGHVVSANFVDLQQFLVNGLVIVDVFGIDAILADVLDTLDVVSQLVLQLGEGGFLLLLLLLLFIDRLAGCLYFLWLFLGVLILFGLLMLVQRRGRYFLFGCSFCLFLLVLFGDQVYFFQLIILYRIGMDRSAYFLPAIWHVLQFGRGIDLGGSLDDRLLQVFLSQHLLDLVVVEGNEVS